MSYLVEFAESVRQQIRALPAHQRVLILEFVENQLVHEPLTETRNRKPIRPNPIAPWELRIGYLRVFYEVLADDPNVVHILAVGQKKGNTLLIAGEEVKL